MASNSKEVAIDMSPFFRILRDGGIERLYPSVFAPPSDDPTAPVRTKDVVIDSQTGLSVRIFAPRRQDPPQKIPLVLYTHGGAYCVGSAFSPVYHNFLSSVAEKSNVIVVSVDYRLAPENPLPICYDDSWAGFRWAAAHANGKGPEPWLNEHADFRRVFLGGESAGGNIANDMAIRAGVRNPPGVEVEGIFLMHPHFGGKQVDTLYKFLCPDSSGLEDDPRLNPAVDPRIGRMAGRRVLFFVADKDFLVERARSYYEGLKKSEWSGEVDIFETEGEGHCFYLFKPNTEKAFAVMDRLVEFLKDA